MARSSAVDSRSFRVTGDRRLSVARSIRDLISLERGHAAEVHVLPLADADEQLDVEIELRARGRRPVDAHQPNVHSRRWSG
jgi:hypothetical protein